MSNFIQADFRGGLNLFDQDIAINDNEYAYALNVRNRTTALEPIKLPAEDTTAPPGKKQGAYAFDNYLLLFCAGRCYYKNIVTDTAWTQIESLSLDPDVDYIYTCPVPASTFNYSRRLAAVEQISGTATDPGINIGNIIVNGTQAGLVVQDGKNQGWLIKPDATAVRLKNYIEWSVEDREYVPVMKQMCFVNGILFGVAPDGKTILRSVSGRPLDFVINVKPTGDKGGDAYTTSYRVGYDTVRYIGVLSSGELLVATDKVCYPIDLNYERTIFAEPTFRNTKQFSAGIVNQFSIVDILGDYGFIDFDGVRSFNAVNQLNNEGRNSVFSARIQGALNAKQTTTAAVVFDNYSLFALDTVYGNALGIFDNIRQQWVGFDDYDLDEQFKMFAVANQGTEPFLYGITDTKLYKLFAGTEYATADVKLKALISGDPEVQIKLKNVYAVFIGSTVAGTASVQEVCNGQANNTVTETLSVKEVQNIKFNFTTLGSNCFKSQARIRWDNDAKLLMVGANIAGMTRQTPLQQTIKRFNES